jgi:hypothetical protein
MNLSTKSIEFPTMRGSGTIYKQGDEIKIKISPSTCPLLDLTNSYLSYTLQMPNNPAYVVPDELIGGEVFERITIMDGNEQTVLTECVDLHLLRGLLSHYGENKNQKNIRGVFSGRVNNVVKPFKISGTINAMDANDVQNNYIGGGFKNQYYDMPIDGGSVGNEITTDNSKKVQCIYTFPLDGLLNGNKTEPLPVIALQGLVIRIKLIPNPSTALQVVQLEHFDLVGDDVGGYANVNSSGEQIFGDIGTLTDNKTTYAIYGYVDNAGANQAGNIPNATQIQGVILKKSGDGGNKYLVDNLNNCAFKVGSTIRCARASVTEADLRGGNFGLSATISKVYLDANSRVVLELDPASAANTKTTTAQLNADIQIVPDLQSKSFNYQITDVNYVASVIQTDAKIYQGILKRFNDGNQIIKIRDYDDYRINVVKDSTISELYIDADNTRAYCLLNFNQKLSTQSVLLDNISPPNNANCKGSEYSLNINGIQVPQLPIDIGRLYDNKVSVLHQIELEKALEQSSIPVRNLIDPSKFVCIGRRFGVDGSTFNLAENPLRLRVQYSVNSDSLLSHNVIYSEKILTMENGQRVIVR